MKILKKIFFIAVILISAITFSQEKEETIKLNLTIKDYNNKPVPGAVILLDNVKQDRVANASGTFKAIIKKAPIEITVYSPMVGVQTVKYLGNPNMIINIKKPTNDDVVDTANEKIADPIQFRDIYDYLRGKVAGVEVTPRNSIIIRGASNFREYKSPLFILNGVQVDEETFAQIVPVTILKIKILKGPETAIYGIRGANGVIEVTTMI
ncbi:TonB-dependent receptor plug domain-containing protein [Polaribacter sp. BAL334]|uniref:TonB-dependent receptor plug domain-containing protein n=1 Tax=Polaribacter sp. BAL334 TaxID=1708178 RepID=UPI0018D20F11|nr:TonB-dependent receptor plug domain-containing protein [Polaribacter sp. BAL334]MBG7611827.1 TonB-dependent receptor plug domain-containing protein [Polaribacter sp. BAL334]